MNWSNRKINKIVTWRKIETRREKELKTRKKTREKRNKSNGKKQK